MKTKFGKTIAGIALLLCAYGAGGCHGDLDIMQDNKLSASNMWKEESDATSATYGLYVYLRSALKSMNDIYLCWGELRNGLWGPGTHNTLNGVDQSQVRTSTMSSVNEYDDGQPGKPGHQACPCDGVEGETAGLLSGERPLHPRVLLLPDRTHLGRCPAAALGLRIDRHGAVPRTHPRLGSADARGTRHCRRGKVRRRYVGQDRGHAGRRGDAEGRLCSVDVPYAGRGRGLPGDGPRGARGTRPVGRPARARVCRYFQFVEQMRPRGHFRRAPGCVGGPERPGLLPRLERELRRSGLPQ